MNKVRKVFNEIKEQLDIGIDNISLKQCKMADEEHKKSKRQYMHTFHINETTICYAKATEQLPYKYIRGLLYHEIGHILSLEDWDSSSESNADRIIDEYFDIVIKYEDCKYGKHLQYVN